MPHNLTHHLLEESEIGFTNYELYNKRNLNKNEVKPNVPIYSSLFS